MTTAIPPTSVVRPAVDQMVFPALSAGVRPPRPSALSASLTLGWRALLKLKHVPEQLADVIFIPILFTLMFTYIERINAMPKYVVSRTRLTICCSGSSSLSSCTSGTSRCLSARNSACSKTSIRRHSSWS
jgi:hypothetical protein